MKVICRTIHGDQCLLWNDSPDRAMIEQKENYEHNYCRNPVRKPNGKRSGPPGNLASDGVWCFTGRGNIWAYCDVPKCQKEHTTSQIESGNENSMNVTKVERKGSSVIVTAAIILSGVSFFLVVVVSLIFSAWCRSTDDDETFELQENTSHSFVEYDTTSL